jgi:hypothetical protein
VLVGANVDVQVADAVVPLRVQVVNDPVTPVTESVTVPVGVIAVLGLTSVTVTVHVEVSPTVTGLVQLTVVLVALVVTITEDVPVLPLWALSPG